MNRAFVTALVLSGCCTVAAAGGSYCEPLLRVVRSAEARDRLADVTGRDAGIYFETAARLPGAQFCFSDPNDWPAATWRCLVGADGKYTLALRRQGNVESRVAECLGPDWSSETSREGVYMMTTVFTKPDSAARVQVMTTKEVEKTQGWAQFRVVVVVFSPREDAPGGGG